MVYARKDDIKNRFDPRVCGIKYLIEVSVSVMLWVIIIIGMKESVFSSIINHTNNIFLDLVASMVLISKLQTKNWV